VQQLMHVDSLPVKEVRDQEMISQIEARADRIHLAIRPPKLADRALVVEIGPLGDPVRISLVLPGGESRGPAGTQLARDPNMHNFMCDEVAERALARHLLA